MNDLPVESNQLLLLWLNKAGFQIFSNSSVLIGRDIHQLVSFWNPLKGTDHEIEFEKF